MVLFSKQLNLPGFESCSVNNAHMQNQRKDHISSHLFLLVRCLPELASSAELCSPAGLNPVPEWLSNPSACECNLWLMTAGMEISGRESSLPCLPCPHPWHHVCTSRWSDRDRASSGALTLPWQYRPANKENGVPEGMDCPTGQKWSKSTGHVSPK